MVLLLLWRWPGLVMIRHRTGRTVPAGLRFGDFIDQRLRATLDEDRDVPHCWLLLGLLLLGHLLLPFPTVLLLVCVNFALPPWSLARCPRGRQLLPLHQPNTHTHRHEHTYVHGQTRTHSLGCSRKRLFALGFSTHDFALIFGRDNISRPQRTVPRVGEVPLSAASDDASGKRGVNSRGTWNPFHRRKFRLDSCASEPFLS